MAAVQNGLTMNFREVVMTKGVNPALAATGATQTNVAVTSTHLIGMANKAVQNIYVVKQAQRTNQAQAQLDMRLNGTRYCNSALNQDGSGLQTVDCSILVSLNGSSDYIDTTIFNNSGANKDTVASPSNNLVIHISGCYMRGQA